MANPDWTISDLVRECAAGDAAAWREFMRRYRQLISVSAMRISRRWGVSSPAAVDDLIQDTYLKLCADHCRVLLELVGLPEAAVPGYLRVLVSNVVHDHFRAQAAWKRGGAARLQEISEAEPSSMPPSLQDDIAVEHAVLMSEIDACLAVTVNPETAERDRIIFWLYYRQGFTAEAISQMVGIGLTTKGVESLVFRLTKAIRSRVGRAPAGQPQRVKGISAGSTF